MTSFFPLQFVILSDQSDCILLHCLQTCGCNKKNLHICTNKVNIRFNKLIFFLCHIFIQFIYQQHFKLYYKHFFQHFEKCQFLPVFNIKDIWFFKSFCWVISVIYKFYFCFLFLSLLWFGFCFHVSIINGCKYFQLHSIFFFFNFSQYLKCCNDVSLVT